MQSKLPSWRVGVLALILVGVGVGAFYLYDENEKRGGLSVLDKEVAHVDTDHDGLADWEEELWRTNPFDRDSDRDGTTDGDEVKNNRHPLVPGPNDAIEPEHKDIIYARTDTITGNLTDSLAERFFPHAAALAYSNISGQKDPSLNLETVTSTFQSDLSEPLVPPTYTEGDLRIVNNPTADDHALYLVDVVDILAVPEYADTTGNELEIAARALEGERVDVSSLEVTADIYNDIYLKLLTMNVPADLVSYHVGLVNGYAAIAMAVEAMSAVEADPARAIQGIQLYQARELALRAVSYALAQQLTQFFN